MLTIMKSGCQWFIGLTSESIISQNCGDNGLLKCEYSFFDNFFLLLNVELSEFGQRLIMVWTSFIINSI